MRLAGKTAIVTGAATGIGEAIAIAFAKEGVSVAVDYVGDATTAQETIDKIAKAGGKSIAVNAERIESGSG